ncbi:hypothetical protein EPN95_04380 [Patescibacteria group bacterium]|nr:MAG: hypothetical protein EPN95_04380 [Patescibacteria group bacterium]
MNITPALLGQLSGILAVIQAVPYIISILMKKTRPARASYAIWSVLQTISAASYLASGATDTKWTPIVLAFSAVIIFSLSIKYGMGGFNKFDITCLSIAAIAIVLWLTTSNPAFAVYASLAASSIAFLPVIKKSFLTPKTENTLSWTLYAVAVLLNVCALTSWNPVIALPPVISLVLSGIIALLLLFQHRIPRKHSL